MFSTPWKMLKETVLAFINDEALSRGAAIAFYTVTSIAPVLLIVIAIAGLAFGQEAAQNAITAQLSDLMGQQTAEVLQAAVASASSKSSGITATIIGIVTLLVTASGVFGEMQSALNVSGRFNLAQGIIGTASGIGAALSTAVFGLIAANFGHTTTFLSMAAVALLGASIMWLLMPETRPSTEK